MLTRTYDAGRGSGEHQKSAGRVSFVRAIWFSYAGRTDPKDFDRLRSDGLKWVSIKDLSHKPQEVLELSPSNS